MNRGGGLCANPTINGVSTEGFSIKATAAVLHWSPNKNPRSSGRGLISTQITAVQLSRQCFLSFPFLLYILNVFHTHMFKTDIAYEAVGSKVSAIMRETKHVKSISTSFVTQDSLQTVFQGPWSCSNVKIKDFLQWTLHVLTEISDYYNGVRLCNSSCLNGCIKLQRRKVNVYPNTESDIILCLPNGSNCINNSQDTNYSITWHLLLSTVSGSVA